MLAPPCGFVSFAHLTETLRQNLHRIPRDIDLVVGIPRSGIIPAYAIALYLNLLAIDLSPFWKTGLPPTAFHEPLLANYRPLMVPPEPRQHLDIFFVFNAVPENF